jgi:O-antigen/teichoic acid export membrane protein
MVHEALLQRNGRLKAYAAIATAQILSECVVAAVLAYHGFGAWALILSKIVSVPVWLVLTRRASTWTRTGHGPVPVREVLQFSTPIVGSDLLSALRFNLDKAIIGALLGVEALGTYSFAFNAGFGLSMTLTSALATAALSHLAHARHSGGDVVRAFDDALWKAILPVAALIGIQALAALIYVPILFGERWAFAAPYVAILCLAATTKPLFDGASQLLRVDGRTWHEVAGTSVFSAVSLSALAVAATLGLMAAVIVYALIALIGQIAFAVWARRLVDRSRGVS